VRLEMWKSQCAHCIRLPPLPQGINLIRAPQWPHARRGWPRCGSPASSPATCWRRSQREGPSKQAPDCWARCRAGVCTACAAVHCVHASVHACCAACEHSAALGTQPRKHTCVQAHMQARARPAHSSNRDFHPFCCNTLHAGGQAQGVRAAAEQPDRPHQRQEGVDAGRAAAAGGEVCRGGGRGCHVVVGLLCCCCCNLRPSKATGGAPFPPLPFLRREAAERELQVAMHSCHGLGEELQGAQAVWATIACASSQLRLELREQVGAGGVAQAWVWADAMVRSPLDSSSQGWVQRQGRAPPAHAKASGISPILAVRPKSGPKSGMGGSRTCRPATASPQACT